MTTSPEIPPSRETLDSGLLSYLIHHLQGFTHHVIKGSSARAFYELQHGLGICKTDVIVTPEREGLFVFSKRHRVMPGFRLLVRDDRLSALAPAMTDNGEVSLDKLLEIEKLRGAFTGTRRYDPAIAAFLAKRGAEGMNNVVATFQLFNLMQAGRIDYAFVAPLDFYFYRDESKLRPLTLLRIAGVAPTFSASVACSGDPTGRAVIADIDSLLADDTQWRGFVEPFRKWLPPADFAVLSNMNGVP